MKAMDKSVMLNRNRNKTPTHVCLITEFCPGGVLFALLDKQPSKIFKAESARFYAAEVVIGLEYLHYLGIIYCDLKPENIILQKDGHVVLIDFDLSFLTSCKPHISIIKHPQPKKKRRSPSYHHQYLLQGQQPNLTHLLKRRSTLLLKLLLVQAILVLLIGILLYEMLYGHTLFRGKNRQRTFANIMHKDLTFPSSIPASLAARQFIYALLSRDPDTRLGTHGGASEIKQHSFLCGINWPLISCMDPPTLEAPLQLIRRDPNAKDVKWDDDGVLAAPMDLF